MEITITPRHRTTINLKELWSYRELFYFLAWRDIKVRYKHTAIGIGWAVLQPLLTMIIFTVFFNKIAGVSSGKINYAVFSYAGLLYWNYFSTALNDVSNSLIAAQSIITKVFFPRIIIPIAASFVALIDFGCALIAFAGLLIIYQTYPSLSGVLVMIPYLLLAVLTAVGLGFMLAILNVKYRDIRYALPFFIQLLLFVTPVIYPLARVPPRWHWLMFLNPLTSVIEGVRAMLFHTSPLDGRGLLISCASCSVMVVLGIWCYQKYEQQIADII